MKESKPKWRRRSTPASSRKVRALDVFVSEKFAEMADDVGFAAKRRRLTTLWKSISPGERAVYEGKADAETEKRRANAGMALASFTDGNLIEDYRINKVVKFIFIFISNIISIHFKITCV